MVFSLFNEKTLLWANLLQTIAQVTLLLEETQPWGSCREDGRLVEVTARLRVNLTVGCPCAGATCGFEGWLSTAPALMGQRVLRGSDRRMNCV